jgi:leader peptidase (prepilin peptidase)/N-methyltransferase
VFEAFMVYPALAIASAFLFGLLIGSFLNVVILRLPPRLESGWKRDSRDLLGLPPEESSVEPPDLVLARSHCPHCGHQLAAWENIPLLSFLLLRGRCRKCRVAISWQYPAVELLTGVAMAICLWHFGIGLQALAAMTCSAILIALTGIDLRTSLLPDQLTYPLLWIGLLLAVFGIFVAPVPAILGAIAGYLSLWTVYWLFKLATGKEGMGHGDFKLLAALGAWCGWQGVLPIVLISALVGAIIGSAWLALRGRDRATPIPFGPYLALAGWIQLLWGSQLIAAYLHVSGIR